MMECNYTHVCIKVVLPLASVPSCMKIRYSMRVGTSYTGVSSWMKIRYTESLVAVILNLVSISQITDPYTREHPEFHCYDAIN